MDLFERRRLVPPLCCDNDHAGKEEEGDNIIDYEEGNYDGDEHNNNNKEGNYDTNEDPRHRATQQSTTFGGSWERWIFLSVVDE